MPICHHLCTCVRFRVAAGNANGWAAPTGRATSRPAHRYAKTEQLEETGKLTSGGLTLHLGSGLCGVQWCHVHMDGAGAASSTSRAGRTAATKDATPFIAASNGQAEIAS